MPIKFLELSFQGIEWIYYYQSAEAIFIIPVFETREDEEISNKRTFESSKKKKKGKKIFK